MAENIDSTRHALDEDDFPSEDHKRNPQEPLAPPSDADLDDFERELEDEEDDDLEGEDVDESDDGGGD